MRHLTIALLALLAACASPLAPKAPVTAPVPNVLKITSNCLSVWKVQVDTQTLGIYWFRGDTLTVKDLAVGDHHLYANQLDPNSGWSLGHTDVTATVPGTTTMLCASYVSQP